MTTSWVQENQRSLTDALAEVRRLLDIYVNDGEHAEAWPPSAQADRMPPPPALEAICSRFGLSGFERSILLVCAGIELDSKFGPLCAAAQGDPSRNYLTFSLALAALPDAHWSAVTPAGPLRRWRLIELGAGTSLTDSPLRIDERVLHFLTGVDHLDDRLVGLVETVEPQDELVASHRELADIIAAAWAALPPESPVPVVQLCGPEPAGKRAVAAAVCATLGLSLASLDGRALPVDPRELDALVRLWEREAALSESVLLLDCDDVEGTDAVRETAISQVVATMRSALFLSGRERRRSGQRPGMTLEVTKPRPLEQRALWQRALGTATANGHADVLVSQFDLGPWGIRDAASEALRRISDDPKQSAQAVLRVLWEACRMQARPKMDDLAQRIEAMTQWDDLVLPEGLVLTLKELLAQAQHRSKVYETWGFATKSARGLGISALFEGASGTGKTLAAEVLASEMHLDLYRIDLSQVVSKYIGETEKNLRAVFDAAEEGGAVLLFDEADALFGKRSEVKDSHDRYANIEVGYLLQRMESYRGLAILTTNLKEAVDPAFLRRIRFIVHFPFPDAALRSKIWQRMFPAEAPTEGLDSEKLARLNATGGTIRNIALNAAFLAAHADEPIRMSHVLRAARNEYGKLERTLTEVEVRGWI